MVPPPMASDRSGSVPLGARQRSRGPDFRRVRGNNRIAHSDLPSDEDLGAKTASVDQAGEHAPARQSLQMGAWLAQSNAAEPNAAHEELLADEMVQGHSPSDDVPTRVARGDREVVIAGHRRDRLGFDQRYFPGGAGPARVPRG